MGRPKLNLIKPLLGVARTSDGNLLQRLNAVHDGMFNNPAYPNPPVEMSAFKAGINVFTGAAIYSSHFGEEVAIGGARTWSSCSVSSDTMSRWRVTTTWRRF